MIYLKLFLTFLEIGAVSFGGGYAMISMIREKVLLHGWMSEEELINIIAVAESTPGPIEVNMETFVGSTQAGILGALLATLGVVLPSFIIILLIASVIRGFLKFAGVKAALSGGSSEPTAGVIRKKPPQRTEPSCASRRRRSCVLSCVKAWSSAPRLPCAANRCMNSWIVCST